MNLTITVGCLWWKDLILGLGAWMHFTPTKHTNNWQRCQWQPRTQGFCCQEVALFWDSSRSSCFTDPKLHQDRPQRMALQFFSVLSCISSEVFKVSVGYILHCLAFCLILWSLIWTGRQRNIDHQSVSCSGANPTWRLGSLWLLWNPSSI